MQRTIETMADNRRWFIKYDRPTAKGETLVIELTRCEADPKDKHSLPYVAKKRGWSDKQLSSYWGVQTYTTDDNGTWGECYNPLHKLEPYEQISNGKRETTYRYTTDFDWWLADTDENAEKIISENW